MDLYYFIISYYYYYYIIIIYYIFYTSRVHEHTTRRCILAHSILTNLKGCKAKEKKNHLLPLNKIFCGGYQTVSGERKRCSNPSRRYEFQNQPFDRIFRLFSKTSHAEIQLSCCVRPKNLQFFCSSILPSLGYNRATTPGLLLVAVRFHRGKLGKYPQSSL